MQTNSRGQMSVWGSGLVWNKERSREVSPTHRVRVKFAPCIRLLQNADPDRATLKFSAKAEIYHVQKSLRKDVYFYGFFFFVQISY